MIINEFIANKEINLNRIKKEWLEAKETFPYFLSEISYETKQKNEAYIEQTSSDLQKQLSNYKRIPLGRKRWKQNTLNRINDLLYHEEILGMHHFILQPDIDSFCEELKVFIRQVKRFSPELSFSDIGQAIRNYIVYAMFKKLHRIETGFDLAAFGYSMLYPFTDNYIDDMAQSSDDKDEYNRLILDKIKRRDINPKTRHQQKTCQLLQYIEDLYPRDKDDTASSLLLMMLDAQEKSLRQQNRDLPLTDDERLDISIYKGGISVLIDRFLVNKTISEEDLIFYLGFGFFLQLADDLQDIKEDSSQGHSSLFTKDLSSEPEERTVNKLLNFVHNIATDYKAEDEKIKVFLLNNSYQLIYSSLIRSKEYFSEEYLTKIENYLPVTIEFWEKLSNNRIETLDIKLQNHYMKILEELI